MNQSINYRARLFNNFDDITFDKSIKQGPVCFTFTFCTSRKSLNSNPATWYQRARIVSGQYGQSLVRYKPALVTTAKISQFQDFLIAKVIKAFVIPIILAKFSNDRHIESKRIRYMRLF
ncbi:hypothetical protein IP69_05370 [Bosea sp. AAP35]|nr:hypothetical protein IP69_05370 [Bosea sp. AAP35]